MTELKPSDDGVSDGESVLDFLTALARPVVFRHRPSPIPGDLRTSWRLSSLALILDCTRGGTASLAQIHVLSWAMRTQEARELLIRWFAGEKRPDEVLVRFDPSVSASIDLAIGFGLATRDSKADVKISPVGKSFARDLWAETDALISEKEFLKQLPSRISKKAINDLLDWR